MREVLDACERSMAPVAIPAGQTLLAEGKRAGVLFVLAEGEVEISKGDIQKK